MLRLKTIKIEIIADDTENVLEQLKNKSLPLTNIEYVKRNHLYLTIHTINVITLQRLVSQLKNDSTIHIVRVSGIIPKIMNILCRYEFVLAFMVSMLLLFLCMNIIWKVEIDGVSNEVEYKLAKVLQAAQLKEGNWLPKTDNFTYIEQQLLKEVPALLFVRLKRTGNYIHVEAIEKTEIISEDHPTSRVLKASKSGIIRNVFISSGIAVVTVNDYVKTGDSLVVTYEQTDADEENDIFDYVDGKVFAETWYEVIFEQHIPTTYEQIIREAYETYEIILGNWQLALPHFQKWQAKEQTEKETSLHHLYFLKWKTPITLRKTVHWQITEENRIPDADDRLESIIQDGLEQFKSKIGHDVEILMYDVLYDTIEEDKLQVKLFVSVYENIAVP